MKAIVVLVVSLLLTGCCNPQVLESIKVSKMAVQQAYYDVTGQMNIPPDMRVALGGIAADSALLLAGKLQEKWCPKEGEAKQLKLQVEQLPLIKK
jgi:hypothetical protein